MGELRGIFLSDEEDEALTKISEIKLGKGKKGEFARDQLRKIIKGKSQHESDPVSTVLVKIEQKKLELKTLRKEGDDLIQQIVNLKEIEEITKKLPAFIDMRHKHEELYSRLCNSALTGHQIDQLFDELEHLKREFDREVIFKWAKAIDFFNNKPVTNIYEYEHQFVNEKTWELLRTYRAFTHGDADISCYIVEEAIPQWIIRQWYVIDKYSDDHTEKPEIYTFYEAFPELTPKDYRDREGRDFQHVFPDIYARIQSAEANRARESAERAKASMNTQKPMDSEKTETTTESKDAENPENKETESNEKAVLSSGQIVPINEAEKVAKKLGLTDSGK